MVHEMKSDYFKTTSTTDQFFQIGQVLKSNGTDGQLVISLREIDASDISEKEPVFIFFDELPVPYFISDIQRRGSNKILAHLTDTSTLEDAEELVGRGIYLKDEDGQAEGEMDFTGWTLIADGRQYSVTGVEDIPGNPCIIVESDDGEVLVPLHEDLIVEIDPERQQLEMSLPEGLL